MTVKPRPSNSPPSHVDSLSKSNKINSFVSQSLGSKLLVGYWHNFDNGIGILPLSQVNPNWDVIDLSFGETASDYATVIFVPCYGTVASFILEIKGLQSQGKKVLLSLGGQNGVVTLSSNNATQTFINSIYVLVNQYGFDGIDIDLENGIILGAGDKDFTNPQAVQIINLIAAIKAIKANYGSNFIISMAPEIAYVQGGMSAYAGVWGAYLPIIYGVKDILTYIHVQHYNAGGAVGKDGNSYQQGTADFEVAMADALLSGFPVGSSTFPALRPDQVLIGLPACSQAAPSGGYIVPTELNKALDYLTKGISFGGTYKITNPVGYPGFRGLMTWSINWDKYNNFQFSQNYQQYFEGSSSSTTSPTNSSSSNSTGTTSSNSSGNTSNSSGTQSSPTTNLSPATLSASAVDSTGSYALTAVVPSPNSAISYTWYEGNTQINTSNYTSQSSPVTIKISGKSAGTYKYDFSLSNATSCVDSSINVTVPAQTISTNSSNTTSSYPAWTVGTTYKPGDIVVYNGVNYKCIIGHTAIASWNPPAVLALWNRI